MNRVILETERLILREMTQEDYAPLCLMLRDVEVMYAYEHAFSADEAQVWLNRQMQRYLDNGFGLWAVILKSSGAMIGQCGLTLQDYNGKQVVEVGYLMQKAHWHNGYATEAAIASKNYAFNNLGIDMVYSIIRENNIASRQVALRNGMLKVGELVKHYYNIDMLHYVYSVANNSPSERSVK